MRYLLPPAVLLVLLSSACSAALASRLDAGLGTWTVEDVLTELGTPSEEKDTGIHLILKWRTVSSRYTRELIVVLKKSTGKMVKWRHYKW